MRDMRRILGQSEEEKSSSLRSHQILKLTFTFIEKIQLTMDDNKRE
jgi:hypothetical protein